MSKDRLVYDEYSAEEGRHQLIWWITETEDYGGVLGECPEYTDDDLIAATGDDRENIIAYLVAFKTEGVERDDHGFNWPTKARATAALRAIRTALKLDTGSPWPDWALKAQAAGWQPPKGWRP